MVEVAGGVDPRNVRQLPRHPLALFALEQPLAVLDPHLPRLLPRTPPRLPLVDGAGPVVVRVVLVLVLRVGAAAAERQQAGVGRVPPENVCGFGVEEGVREGGGEYALQRGVGVACVADVLEAGGGQAVGGAGGVFARYRGDGGCVSVQRVVDAAAGLLLLVSFGMTRASGGGGGDGFVTGRRFGF